jgi:hypothetical protein
MPHEAIGAAVEKAWPFRRIGAWIPIQESFRSAMEEWDVR